MKHSFNLSYLGAVLVAIAAATAPAHGSEPTRWQIDVKYGESSLDDSFGDFQPGVFDDESNIASVEFGYQFNDYIGVQAGIHDLGTFDGSGSPCFDIEGQPCIQRLATLNLCVEGSNCQFVIVPLEAEITGWSAAAVPSYPFTDRFSVFGKVGVLDWDADIVTTGNVLPGFGQVGSFSETDLLASLGLRYRFGRHVSAVLEHQRLDLDLASSTLGVGWAF